MAATGEIKVTVVIADYRVMDEAEFKRYLLRLLREAINQEDAVIIQPASNQGVILREDHT